MIHQGSGGFRGNTPDVFIQVKELESLININHEILAKHTGQTVEKINKDTERDYFMSPEEAKAYGIIDEVYAVPDQSLISEAKQGHARRRRRRCCRGRRRLGRTDAGEELTSRWVYKSVVRNGCIFALAGSTLCAGG